MGRRSSDEIGLAFGIILGVVAGTHGAPKRLVLTVEIASLPLPVVGFPAGGAV